MDAERPGWCLIVRGGADVDILKDLFAEMQLNALIADYRQDKQRRFFLTSLYWAESDRLPRWSVAERHPTRRVRPLT